MTEERLELFDEMQEDFNEKKVLMTHLGFSTLKTFLEYRDTVIHVLNHSEDKFFRRLGSALYFANFENALKILRYWQIQIEQMVVQYKIVLAHKNALSQES